MAARASYGGGGEPCDACGKTVYLAERVLANRCMFHKDCLKCSTCGKKLAAGGDWHLDGTTIYCKAHLLQKRKSEPEVAGKADAPARQVPLSHPPTRGLTLGGGGERCCRCDKTVYSAERVAANGRVWHKECFRCTTCGSLLGPSGWGKDAAGELYCHHHHAQLVKASGMKVDGGQARVPCVETHERWAAQAPPPQAAPLAPPPPPPPPPPLPAWSEYCTPDGRAYFHNAQTGETSWETPPGWNAAPHPPYEPPQWVAQHAAAASIVRSQGHHATAATSSSAAPGGGRGASGPVPIGPLGGPAPWELLPPRETSGGAKPISSAAQEALRHLQEMPLPSDGAKARVISRVVPEVAAAAAATSDTATATAAIATRAVDAAGGTTEGPAPWDLLLAPKAGAAHAEAVSLDPAAARREAAHAALRDLRGLGATAPATRTDR